MTPTSWDKEKERLLLLQIIALNEIKVTISQWDQIAQIWNNGNKGDSFRKHFAKMKEESVKMMDESGMVVGSEHASPSAKKGQKRSSQGKPMAGKGRKKAKVLDLDGEMEGEGNFSVDEIAVEAE